jgi:inosine-uridine nucleoside N-ribohydrolase
MVDLMHKSSQSLQGVFARRLWLSVLLATLLFTANTAVAAQRCIVIDTDAALDDYRAISALASTGQIAAIVVTEGIARGPEGAGAMEKFLNRAGLSIPVLVGAAPRRERGYNPSEELQEWRSNAERLNGLLSTAERSLSNIEISDALRPHVGMCDQITLLIIGPWTSFIRYAPEFLSKVDQIVAQGRPFPDELGGEPAGFNCVYDKDSCMAAFDLLIGRQKRTGKRLRASWVDIPNGPDICGTAEPGIDVRGDRQFVFSPSISWAGDLERAGGIAKVVADMLRANAKGFEKTSLWDDLAALFILRPVVFGVRGGHLEPCISAQSARELLARFMSKK